MLDALRRMFSDARPIDTALLIIEVFVLILIAYEVGHAVWDRFKTKRWLAAAFKYMARGQALQNSVPSGVADEVAVDQWVGSVKEWIRQTGAFLERHSPQAAASFIHDEGRPALAYRGVAVKATDWYRTLEGRLNNLRMIMEKPDVYR